MKLIILSLIWKAVILVNKVEELIKEKCLSGVQYKKISEVYKRIKGTPITAGKMKEIEDLNGEIRIFAGGKTVINAREKNIPNANITRVPAVLVQSRGIIDFVYYDKPFTFKNEMWAYTNDNVDSVKFLYYLLKNNIVYFRKAASGMGSMPQISLPVTEEFEIPVPPLEIQKEIVHILDKFTELEAGLQAELDARKKQYENYRDNLLEFPDDVERVRLGDICKIGDGLHSTPKYDDNGEYFFVNGNNLRNKTLVYDSKTKRVGRDEFEKYDLKLPVNTLLMSINGTIGRVSIYAGEEVILGKSIAYFSIIDNKKLDFSFLYYLLQTTYSADYYNKSLTGSSILNLGLAALRTYVVPLPPVQKQKEIVNLLQKLETLSNSLEEGLPAEIEARHKQYEYYRDKLLTFKRKVV